jgi:hypothetical protein
MGLKGLTTLLFSVQLYVLCVSVVNKYNLIKLISGLNKARSLVWKKRFE